MFTYTQIYIPTKRETVKETDRETDREFEGENTGYISPFKEHSQVSVVNFFRQVELRQPIRLVTLQANQRSKIAKR